MTDIDAIRGLGETKLIPIDDLLLDDLNPRLPLSQHGLSQDELAVDLEMGFEAFEIAKSISENGYFSNEPLIAIPSGSKFVVVEGNRRLTALIGLTRKETRVQFETPDPWEELAQKSGFNGRTKVPVVLAASREACIPVIGWRHISGIKKWEPHMQARFVSSLIDNDNKTFEEVADLIGIEKGVAASLYRDQAIAKQALKHGIDTGNLERSFSLLQVAMSNTKIRDFVGVPTGAKTIVGSDPVPKENIDQLAEVFKYVFGSGEREPVISDSRKMSTLANVISEDAGLKALRDGATLDSASQKIKDTVGNPKDLFVAKLNTAKRALSASVDDIGDFIKDSDVVELISELREVLSSLEKYQDNK